MSTNNLSEQLSWLFTSRPFSPSLPLDIAAALAESPSGPNLLEEQQAIATLGVGHIASGDETQLAPNINVSEWADVFEEEEGPTSEDMARLRCAPTARNSEKDDEDHKKTIYRRDEVQSKKISRVIPPVVDFHVDAKMETEDEDIPGKFSAGKHVRAATAMFDIDMVDLTGDSPDNSMVDVQHQAQAWTPKFSTTQKAGRKRKSSEITTNSSSLQSSSQRRQPASSVPIAQTRHTEEASNAPEFQLDSVEPQSPHPTTAAFDDIDDLFGESSGCESDGECAAEQETELSIVQQQTYHKAAWPNGPFHTDPISGQDEPKDTLVSQVIIPVSRSFMSDSTNRERSPTPVPHTVTETHLNTKSHRTRMIADSDDEGADILTAPGRGTASEALASIPTPDSNPRDDVSSRPNSPLKSRVMKLKLETPLLTNQQFKDRASSSTPTPSGTTSPSGGTGTLYACEIPDVPRLETFKHSDEAINDFIEWTTEELRQQFQSIVSEHRDKSKAFVDDMMETGVKSIELDKDCQMCKTRLLAFKELMALRDRHSGLSEERRVHRQRLLEIHAEGGEPDPLPGVAVVQKLRDNEVLLLQSIKTVNLGRAPHLTQADMRLRGSNVEVHSSQSTTNDQNQELMRTTSDLNSTQKFRPAQTIKSIAAETRLFPITRSPPTRDIPQSFGTGQRSVMPENRQQVASKYIPPPNEAFVYDEADFEDDMEAMQELEQHHMDPPPGGVGYSAARLSNTRNGIEEDLGSPHDSETKRAIPSTFPAPPRRDPLTESTGNRLLGAGCIAHPEKSSKLNNAFTADESAFSMRHPWSADVKNALTRKFKLRGFRPHQLDAINTTLAGKDVFVLMPTGGGKSLCYQLPAVIQSGKTKGVTVVISPLLSLMEDQVSHLQKLNVQASMMNSDSSKAERGVIMDALREHEPDKFIQLLYITPEMISKSAAIVNALKGLHSRGRLARIVIDEAHCVSQWGHDFRPDYKALGEVRSQFQGVPVIALTATATENVKVDVMHNLNITGCAVFTQSFNRPNLSYEVRSKGKKKELMDSIADIINTKHKRQSGIIYCLARKKCEEVAKELNDNYKIRAHHYHAAMTPEEKQQVQRDWQANKYHVIVATIAFGMGIDKPDVRFVIHHSIPKSLEGYYQETGRAGRDGKRSGCYLFYGYQDVTVLMRMIREGEGSQEQIERQMSMLRNMVQYCENQADCRRVQVLAYFSEKFSKEDCNGQCDNCDSGYTYETKDLTDYAISAISLVQELGRSNTTIIQCIDIFRGVNAKRVKDAGLDQLEQFGAGADLSKNEVERLFYRLVGEDALNEHNVVNKAGFASQYIGVSSACSSYRP